MNAVRGAMVQAPPPLAAQHAAAWPRPKTNFQPSRGRWRTLAAGVERRAAPCPEQLRDELSLGLNEARPAAVGGAPGEQRRHAQAEKGGCDGQPADAAVDGPGGGRPRQRQEKRVADEEE